MTLPTPRLDDRTFQDLVDEAKRRIPRLAPEWTDHNVSDPGVALIELFAYMTDQLLYRVNRVPDRHYVKFLELIGLRLFPPAPARVPVTFWLSAPASAPVPIPAGVEVATVRREQDAPIVFRVDEGMTIEPPVMVACLSSTDGKKFVDHFDALRAAKPFLAFTDQNPAVDEQLLFGFSNSQASHAISLLLDLEVGGIGGDPDHPPLVWETWVGDHWALSDVERDDTAALNWTGEVIVHVDRAQTEARFGETTARWIRCRVVTAPDGSTYSRSPKLRGAVARAVGGTVDARHAELVRTELLGRSQGLPAEAFRTRFSPVLPREPDEVLEVRPPDGDWEAWTEVDDFSASDGDDPHYTLDAASGEIRFGPLVRQPDGSVRQFGKPPIAGSLLRMRAYRIGGGRIGNVGAGTIVVLREAIPYVDRVVNRRAARGGVDAEELANALQRGPRMLKARNRAVTAEDFESLAAEASRDVARVACIQPGADDDPSRPPAGTIAVLVVPRVADPIRAVPIDELRPSQALRDEVARYLDARRLLTARVVVSPPTLVGVKVTASLRSAPGADPEAVRARAEAALYRYCSPWTGGPARAGWPFGRPIHIGEVFAVLGSVEGVAFAESAVLAPTDLERGTSTAAVERLEVPPTGVVCSATHAVTVQPA
jgi:predicted phage baseplate assembly protein